MKIFRRRLCFVILWINWNIFYVVIRLIWNGMPTNEWIDFDPNNQDRKRNLREMITQNNNIFVIIDLLALSKLSLVYLCTILSFFLLNESQKRSKQKKYFHSFIQFHDFMIYLNILRHQNEQSYIIRWRRKLNTLPLHVKHVTGQTLIIFNFSSLFTSILSMCACDFEQMKTLLQFYTHEQLFFPPNHSILCFATVAYTQMKK